MGANDFWHYKRLDSCDQSNRIQFIELHKAAAIDQSDLLESVNRKSSNTSIQNHRLICIIICAFFETKSLHHTTEIRMNMFRYSTNRFFFFTFRFHSFFSYKERTLLHVHRLISLRPTSFLKRWLFPCHVPVQKGTYYPSFQTKTYHHVWIFQRWPCSNHCNYRIFWF